MVDFDTIDKYVAAVKRGGVAIQMKQFHNLDRFIEEVWHLFLLLKEVIHELPVFRFDWISHLNVSLKWTIFFCCPV